jgi:hypothetical protein
MAKCQRCGGTGLVEYQFGKPGTDRHAKYIDVEWGPKVERECPVCISTGTAKQPRKERPERGLVALHASEEALQQAMKGLEIFNEHT